MMQNPLLVTEMRDKCKEPRRDYHLRVRATYVKRDLHKSKNAPLLLLPPPLSHFSRVRLCATPEMAAHQVPPSLGFSRQEHWSGLPFPSPLHQSEK